MGELFTHDQFIRPRYQDLCFADLPDFIKSLLLDGQASALKPAGFEALPQRYRHVVLLFLDSFGWRFFQAQRERWPFLRRFDETGSVTKLTAQFPSTTSAHVTTLFTGQPVGQHGVLEWHYYEPLLDAMIMPLPMSFAGDRQPGTLVAAGVEPAAILPRASLAGWLARHGVTSYIYQSHLFAFSPYSNHAARGGEVVAYHSLAEGLVLLSQLLGRQRSPAFHFFYYAAMDTTCHHHGPDSPHMAAEIEATMAVLELWMQRDVLGKFQDTLLLVSADHGQASTDPATSLYINQLPQFNKLAPLLRRNRQGQLLAPAGSPRDFFLYTKEGAVEDAQAILADMLWDKADVVRISDLIEAGYFGPHSVSDNFLAHAGDLAILPYEGEAVWWYEKDRFEQKYRGHHGGLTRSEMEIPLLLLSLE